MTGPLALLLTFGLFLGLGLVVGSIIRLIEVFCTSLQSPRLPPAPFARVVSQETQNND